MSSMTWERLLSLKRFGDTQPRLRKMQDPTRLGFEVDYDRIIFSPTFRSLQDKTQVVPLSKTEFVHTRLTHSLEVSVVGRSLGRLVGRELLKKYPYLQQEFGYEINDFGAIVAAACLAHDIGNPPFGHSGEKAIGSFFEIGKGKKYKSEMSDLEWQDLIKFEGNANGFSVLAGHRPGVVGGLRLSYATLGAFMKYPKASLPHKPSAYIGDKKFGFFQTEALLFEDIAYDLGLLKNRETQTYARHPLTYLVEAADDICYTIIDFEDGINLGLISEDYALEFLIKLVKDAIDTPKYHSLTTVEDRISYLRAIAINSLIHDAVRLFLANEDVILKGQCPFALMDKSVYKAQIADIIDLSIHKIYRSKEVTEKEVMGYRILNGLLETFGEAYLNYCNNNMSSHDALIMRLLPQKYQVQKETTYERWMHMCRFVSLLTDGKARELHRLTTVGDSFF